jgi:tRNA U34 5-methylaminomethyl-2-thiouridine-forming methyltransferase MnmC
LISGRIIQSTEDGSHTIAIPTMQITYHSKHGAMQESMHVFIKEGLHFVNENVYPSNQTIHVFEAGFGTGLNALLSLQYAVQRNRKLSYEMIEAFPLTIEEISQLNYTSLLTEDLKHSFIAMHECEWNQTIQLHALFALKKIKADLQQFETAQKFHVIFFDAFDSNTQPELWTENIFKKMFDMLYANGVLATYCSKGIVQRVMKAAGFKIEKLKGPPGKREIIRATKLN